MASIPGEYAEWGTYTSTSTITTTNYRDYLIEPFLHRLVKKKEHPNEESWSLQAADKVDHRVMEGES